MAKPKWWERIENGARRFESRRKGWATYIGTDGRVRASRRIREGELITMPIEHVGKVRHNGK